MNATCFGTGPVATTAQSARWKKLRPDASGRAGIFARYAKHLSRAERRALAEQAEALSGRDILDACKQAERRWVYAQLVSEREAAGGLRLPHTGEEEGETVTKTKWWKKMLWGMR